MTPKTKSVVLSLGLAALVARCGRSPNISKEPERGIVNVKMESILDVNPDSSVHTIVMPHDERVFPPRPGHDEFVSACVVSLCFAKILCALKITRFPPETAVPSRLSFTLERQESVPGNPSGISVYIRMEEPGRFHDADVGSDQAARSYRWCSPPSRG